jgi:hypothetical protein
MARAQPGREPAAARRVVIEETAASFVRERLGPWVEKSRSVTLPVVGVCLLMPPLLGFGTFAYLPVAGLVGLLGLSFALAEDREVRGLFIALWALSLSVALVMLLLIFGAGQAAGGPFLGPDSTIYLKGSTDLARRNFHLSGPTWEVFGTLEVVHCYVYAALVWMFGADLFAIQLFNCGVIALAGPLTFAASRFVVPRFALLAGMIVSVNPELTMLAARDLLKDPLVVLTLTAAIWALIRVWRADRPQARFTNAAFAALILTSLRFGRFYTELYLAISVTVVMLLVLARRRPAVPAAGIAAATLISVFVATELAAAWLGSPTAPWLLYGEIQHVRRTPLMKHATAGLIDALALARATPEAPARATPEVPARATPEAPARATPEAPARATPEAPARATPEAPARATPETPARATPEAPARVTPLARATPEAPARATAAAPPPEVPAGLTVASQPVPPSTPAAGSSASAPAIKGSPRGPAPEWLVGISNAIRKLYGPFVWIVPERWDLKEILTADYLLYPGMLIWYAVLPLAALGLLLTLWRTLLGREASLALMALGLFTAVYFAQYLIVNLSYRQRVSVFPIVVLFGFVGLATAVKVRAWKRWYAGYWGALVLIAVTHLISRALAHR